MQNNALLSKVPIPQHWCRLLTSGTLARTPTDGGLPHTPGTLTSRLDLGRLEQSERREEASVEWRVASLAKSADRPNRQPLDTRHSSFDT